MRREANLGLKANLNLLVAYDPLWPAAFEDEKVRLAKALGPLAKGIEHYGSTAVPGLCAKPILDIMVGVSPLSEMARKKWVPGLNFLRAAPTEMPDVAHEGRNRGHEIATVNDD